MEHCVQMLDVAQFGIVEEVVSVVEVRKIQDQV